MGSAVFENDAAADAGRIFLWASRAGKLSFLAVSVSDTLLLSAFKSVYAIVELIDSFKR